MLVEKFHPDLRLLKSGRYALYEYHPSTGGIVFLSLKPLKCILPFLSVLIFLKFALRFTNNSLFSIHHKINLTERRLGAEERPLMNQINWKINQREGRFILRDESKLDVKVSSTPVIG